MRNVRFSQQRKPLIYKLVPGAGIEPARLAAGDFEFAIYGVCIEE
jgi:hypothetical protein